jgi:transcription elongation factor Elf1
MVTTYYGKTTLPCPKCGKKPTVYANDEYQYRCKTCGLKTMFYLVEEHAQDEWNRIVLRIKYLKEDVWA